MDRPFGQIEKLPNSIYLGKAVCGTYGKEWTVPRSYPPVSLQSSKAVMMDAREQISRAFFHSDVRNSFSSSSVD